MEEPWQADGPRYVVSLQDAKDTTLYKDIFESNKFEEAKNKAEEIVRKNNRSVLVFDRKHPLDLHKISVKDLETQVITTKIKKKTEPEKPTKKTATKDDYFD